MNDEAVRLSKRVAALVPCSRSEAERYIEGGWVRVDDKVVDMPQARVSEAQAVTLDKGASLLALMPITLLYHQTGEAASALPTAGQQWPGDRSGVRVLAAHFRALKPLLPLPTGAAGLAVYSQDGRILRKLTEDALAIEQEILAEVTGDIREGGLARLAHGLSWRNQPLPPIKASWQSERRLRFAIKGIDPAILPWMCAQVGLNVTQLRRIRVGRLPMAGLPPGQWRYLLPHERF
ncbi:MAG TPA: RNA pseudouridine synthase [Ramlibacter sp.]|nr:RNA pseudouridine synthase [Ramlibacter sp.]